jgi:methyl-accepting chemotaxis protein
MKRREMNTILGRTTLSFLAFICLLAAILASTILVTNQQKDDGLIVNLSGRQRMLSQKMTKETLIFFNLAGRGADAELAIWKEQVLSTIKVFHVTLNALKDGGAAPLNLSMSKHRDVPPAATSEIREQLEKVVFLWKPIQTNIQHVLETNGQDLSAMNYVIDNNVALLQAMDRAVFLMQYNAERKVALMVKIQAVAIGFGALIVILSLLLLRKSVVKPIGTLIQAADLMSKGDLQREILSSGMKEIADLSRSLNRMRVSLIKMMEIVK